MTFAEWQAHVEVWERLQEREDQAADFHVSRICAYIQNWSGYTGDGAVQPRDLMQNPPALPGQPQQTPEEVRAILDQLAMDQMMDRMKWEEQRRQ